MQQHPDPIRTRRTQPALPGVDLPTAPIAVVQGRPYTPVPPTRNMRIRNGIGPILFQLCLLAVLLEMIFVALYPLFAHVLFPHTTSDPLQHALLTLLPWLPQLYWSSTLPALPQLLTQSSWPSGGIAGNSNLQLLLLSLACLCVLLATIIGSRATQTRPSGTHGRVLFWTILLCTALFGVTLLVAPFGLNVFTQDTLLYGLYGRMLVFYHVNPYVIAPLHVSALSRHDPLLTMLDPKLTDHVAPYGPVWLDFTLLVTMLTRGTITNMLLGFRIVGLVAHLVNVGLVWVILTKLKPETRVAATLLYAWNPFVLLFSIPLMHLDVVMVMLLLLAVLFYQRNSLTLSWVFVLLASLMNLFCLLLLPIFFRFMIRESRILRSGGRVFLWISTIGISVLVVALAYAPYWQFWGLDGFLGNIHSTFLQDTAINSLDAALLHLPVQLPAPVQWIVTEHHWSALALGIAGLFILFGVWLADTLELALVFNTWVLLILVILLPVFWPISLLAPLALALCSTNRHTIIVAVLLSFCSFFGYYYWQWPSPWLGQGLVTIGVPLLLWGWVLFFTSTWQMTHANEPERPEQEPRLRRGARGMLSVPSFSRPPRPSNPSRSGRTRY